MADAVTYRATGKRKTSVARVTLTPGVGTVVINGRAIDEYFGRKVLETIALMPFETTRTAGKFDVKANVHGSGISAQSLVCTALEAAPAEEPRRRRAFARGGSEGRHRLGR